MTLENRDLSKEGIWRDRGSKKLKGLTDMQQPMFVAEYLGEVLSTNQFISKYCPDWKNKDINYYRSRGYPPAECIVRYNSKNTPIHIPDVEYTWRDLYLATLVTPTKKVIKEKAKRDKKEDFIKRKLII